jgi:hypothetical protein
MTITRLMLVVSIAIALIDYTTNEGRLMASVGELATRWGIWLSEQLSRLTNQISPVR